MGRVYSLITLYNPDESVVKKSKQIAAQTEKAFLCDNSNRNNSALFQCIENAAYMANMKNLGLPGAFNKILRDPKLSWHEDDIIIFFDQDSEIKEGYIERLIFGFKVAEKEYKNLGCYGPVFFNTSNGTVEIPKIKQELLDGVYKVRNIITSSMVVRYKNLQKIGFWNEKLFLDLADWDLCWRMEANGMLCCITDSITLYHSVGDGEKRVGPFTFRVGQPVREYYQTRNALNLLEEGYIPFKMRVRLFANVTVRPILHYMFLNEKKQRVKYIKKGFMDYHKGVHGELQHDD